MEHGVTWLGLNQAAGSTRVQWAEGGSAVFDPIPRRSGGASPYGGNDECCRPYFNFTTFVYDFVYDYVENPSALTPDYLKRPAWDNCAWPAWFGVAAGTGGYTATQQAAFYGECEPNNFGVFKVENCVVMYSRANQTASWNDIDCTLEYGYVCAKPAYCEPGYYMTKPFVPMPVRVDPSIDPLYFSGTNVNSSLYSTGVCTQCPAGFYHLQDMTQGLQSGCTQCPAGTYGLVGSVNASCTGPCPTGFYCPAGTSLSTVLPCPAGTYNPYPGQSLLSACLTVPAGYYTLNNASSYSGTTCDAGKCGFPGATSSACQAVCPAGYTCATGTGCLNLTSTPDLSPQPCGQNNLYSTGAATVCQHVSAGYYTVGPTALTRTNQTLCPAGAYCTGMDGYATLCPNGTYNSLIGQSSLAACQNCTAGYFCTAGSTSGTPAPCGLDLTTNSSNPQAFYCPAGTPFRVPVSTGYYTLPTDPSLVMFRTDEASCGSLYVCDEGLAYSKVTWGGDSCSDLTVNENLISPPTGRVLNASVFHTLNASAFNIVYSLIYWGLTPSFRSNSSGQCDPNNASNTWYMNQYFDAMVPRANIGIFQVDPVTGELQVTRTQVPQWLDYETCGYKGLQYTMTVQFNATDSLASTVQQCSFTINVADVNDQPVWPYENPDGPNHYIYRAVLQKQVANTAVLPCDGSTWYGKTTTYHGCPIISNNVYVQAYDEDFSTVLRYSITYISYGGVAWPLSANPFRIDACTGLISMESSYAISYYALAPVDGGHLRYFVLTLTVTDDGNGGRFAPLSNSTTAIIYVMSTP